MTLALAFSLLLYLGGARADDEDVFTRARKELLPRPVTLEAKEMPLAAALGELAKQTGNTVADRRSSKTDPILTLAVRAGTFWSTLQTIATAAGCGISTFQTDRQVALVDGSVSPANTVCEGPLMLQVAGITVARDHKTGAHRCLVTLDVAWEPRFEPLYLEVGTARATFAADESGVEARHTSESQSKVPIAGLGALEVELPLPAPSRASTRIKALEGKLRLWGPSKMLTFAFRHPQAAGKSKDFEQWEEGARVVVSDWKSESSRWSMTVAIDNPKGSPELESFQSWLGNNRIWLEKGKGANRIVWLPRGGDEQVLRETAAHAKISYSFPVPANEKKGPATDWVLFYRTPGPIVELEVPFVFRDLALP